MIPNDPVVKKSLTIPLLFERIVKTATRGCVKEAALIGLLAMGVALAMTCGAAGLFLLELSLLSCLGIYALSGAGAVLMLAWAKTHCRAAA